MSRLNHWIAVVTLLFGGSVPLRANAQGPPQDADIVWDFSSAEHGWRGNADCQLEAVDGRLRVVSSSNDPYFTTPLKSASGWKQLSLRVRSEVRCDAQVFWSVDTADPGAFSERRAARFEMKPARDGGWKTFRVYFRSDQPLSGMRIDPCSRKSVLEIDWIALSDRKPPQPAATPVADLSLPKGFRAELLYSVPPETQGSWVSLTNDDRGRLIACDQYGKLYRVTPPPIGGEGETAIEAIDLKIGMAQGLLYAFDSLYVMVNGAGPGLYRVRDTDGDDKFDEVRLLRSIAGGGEHGPHAVILSPDGKSLYVCGGNHTDLPAPEKSLVPRHWDEDHLLGRQWDARGHAAGKLAPGGWICRTDPEGKQFELVASGFRNEYDIAFNADGELFTYDADMEWDVEAPWYRPTRVNHVTSGAEFGWRSGTGKWPVWYPDSLPAVVNIGPGSPTGVTFGTGAKFPARFQRALFISDWSYGVIYAVHLTPRGASYDGVAERFISAAPLPVTDLVVNPHDGAFYFTIGGRRTQSGLYRVTYEGDREQIEKTTEAVDAEPARAAAVLRQLRRELEALHHPGATAAVEKAWPHLAHPDRHIRFAARVAVEHQPVAGWRERALAARDPNTAIEAMIALARSEREAPQSRMLATLGRLAWPDLSESQQLSLLRAYGLTFIRQGRPTDQERQAVVSQVDAAFPGKSVRLNRELSAVLVYLAAPGVVERTVALLEDAPTQEEQIHYAFVLRNVAEGWSLDLRRRYFEWFVQATSHRGGASFGGFLVNIRKEAVETLSASERRQLAAVVDKPLDFGGPPAETTPRKFVKKWTLDELLPIVQATQGVRDLAKGRKMFAAASCFKCHRFDGEGGANGPDLTGVGRRFNAKDLLESMLEPSKTISDQYQANQFQLADGRTIVGRVVNLNGNNLLVSADMLDPGNLTTIKRDEIEEMAASKTSMMPTGLLDTLALDEVLDLIAYLRSGGAQGPRQPDTSSGD